jgi:hypothetical protein
VTPKCQWGSRNTCSCRHNAATGLGQQALLFWCQTTQEPHFPARRGTQQCLLTTSLTCSHLQAHIGEANNTPGRVESCNPSHTALPLPSHTLTPPLMRMTPGFARRPNTALLPRALVTRTCRHDNAQSDTHTQQSDSSAAAARQEGTHQLCPTGHQSKKAVKRHTVRGSAHGVGTAGWQRATASTPRNNTLPHNHPPNQPYQPSYVPIGSSPAAMRGQSRDIQQPRSISAAQSTGSRKPE